MRSLQQFWSVRRIGEDKVTLARLGPLRLWLARAEKEWGFATYQGEDTHLMDFAQVPEDVVPDNLRWTHFLFRQAPRDFVFEAAPPDHAIVTGHDSCISIPDGETGLLYLEVPVFVRIRVLAENISHELRVIQSEKLGNCWFGSATDGFLCYSNKATMNLGSDLQKSSPNQIVYEISINNASGSMICFDKISLDLSNTAIYSGMNHLWGSKINVEYGGAQKESVMHVMDAAPDMENDLIEITKASTGETRIRGASMISCCHPD